VLFYLKLFRLSALDIFSSFGAAASLPRQNMKK
jgi:hypothetical protein